MCNQALFQAGYALKIVAKIIILLVVNFQEAFNESYKPMPRISINKKIESIIMIKERLNINI